MEDAKRPVAKSGAATSDGRRARLAAALRENLRKRKAQARARAIAEAGAHPNPLAPEESPEMAARSEGKGKPALIAAWDRLAAAVFLP